TCVVDHVFHRHRKRRGQAEFNHSKRVTDEQDVDTGGVQDLGSGEVVAGKSNDLPTVTFKDFKRGSRYFVLHKMGAPSSSRPAITKGRWRISGCGTVRPGSDTFSFP